MYSILSCRVKFFLAVQGHTSSFAFFKGRPIIVCWAVTESEEKLLHIATLIWHISGCTEFFLVEWRFFLAAQGQTSSFVFFKGRPIVVCWFVFCWQIKFTPLNVPHFIGQDRDHHTLDLLTQLAKTPHEATAIPAPAHGLFLFFSVVCPVVMFGLCRLRFLWFLQTTEAFVLGARVIFDFLLHVCTYITCMWYFKEKGYVCRGRT